MLQLNDGSTRHHQAVSLSYSYRKGRSQLFSYCSDLPGCIATGKTQEEVALNMHKALEMHIAGLKEDHLPVPKGVAVAEFIAISA
jgi:predicted RNase H-like HicB family nuclease